MNRRTAILAVLATITSAVRAQHESSLRISEIKIPEKGTFWFGYKEMEINIDGRTVTLTAKEIADALGAK